MRIAETDKMVAVFVGCCRNCFFSPQDDGLALIGWSKAISYILKKI